MTMEQLQDASGTRNHSSTGRKDSAMANSNVEERLETCHKAQDSICKTVSLHTQQISDLGDGYNDLEEALHKLEQVSNDREVRVRTVERQVRALASMDTIERTDPIDSIEIPASTAAVSIPAAASLARELEIQSMLNDHAQKLRELEHRQISSVLSFSTHDAAQVLLLRLENGDKLQRSIRTQLQAKLSEEEHTQPTPALTGSTGAESTLSTTSLGAKRKSETSLEDDPPVKRRRGRPSKQRSSDSSDIPAPRKQLRGRPPTHGRYSRKTSYASTSSNSASVKESSKTPPITTPAHATQLSDGATGSIGQTGSDEPIAVIDKAWRVITPKSESVDCAISSDRLDEPKSTSSTGYRDTENPGLAAMEKSTPDGLAIPPERRSGRKPKPRQHYEDYVPWKEANLLVGSLRPSAP